MNDVMHRWMAAASLAGAAGVHLLATPVHWNESPVSGVFFAAVSVAGAVAVVALFSRYERPARWLAALVSGGSLALWVASRTVGFPVGTEPLGVADLLASTLAVVTLHALVSLDPERRERVAWRLHFVGATATVLLLAASVAVAAPALAEHGHHDGSPHTH